MFVCLIWFFTSHQQSFYFIKERIFLGWTCTKLGLMFLLKDTMQWRRWGLNPRPRSRVKHSTTEPLCSLRDKLESWYFAYSKLNYCTFQSANNKGTDQNAQMLRLVRPLLFTKDRFSRCHIIDGRCTTLENFFLNNHLNQSDNLILSGQDADTTGCSLHTQISSLIFTSGILA